ncbi:MAG: hypothetical protein HYZ18_05095 [Pseudogulbenkiania sp.]|nr:hypothetical protein [Pseudogulbenkiania sp.]
MVRWLEPVSETSGVTMVSPLHGSEGYWRQLAELYCKALCVDQFAQEIREAEWEAVCVVDEFA